MFNLRTKEHLKRERESFARARAAAAELDNRISEVMDRWAAQIQEQARLYCADDDEWPGRELGRMAAGVMERYGVVL